MDNIHIADGFSGQIMHVIPQPLLREAAKHVLVGELYATHAGWFPVARHHYIVRPNGAEENILIYCLRGKGWFELDGKRENISAGRAFIVPKGCPHAYGAAEKDAWSIHWVHFAGEDAVCYTSLLPRGDVVIPVAPEIARRLQQLFRECYGVFTNGYTQARIIFVSQALRHLLALLFHGNPGFTPGSPTGCNRSFGPTVEHMREHLDGTLGLRDMAKHAGFSVARFSSLFKLQTGFSPVDYYIRLRIQAACRLFDTTSLNISEAARHVGYEDAYYFSRIFRKIMGMPPTDYRKAKKG